MHNPVHATHTSIAPNSPTPLCISVSPFTSHAPPVSSEIIRCDGCKAYLNPFCEIISPGYQWKCNLCYFINTTQNPFERLNNALTPTQQFNSLINEKNNLSFSNTLLNNRVVELVASPNYVLKTPSPPVFLFLFELSRASISNGMVTSLFDIISRHIHVLKSVDQRSKFALVFSGRHTFVLRRDFSFDIYAETDVPFLFLEDILFDCEVDFHASIIDFLMQQAEEAYDLFTSLSVSKKILHKLSGQIYTFITTTKEQSTKTREKAETQIKDLSTELSYYNISFTLFAFPSSNINLSFYYPLIKQTAGMLFYYPNYNASDLYFAGKLTKDINMVFNNKYNGEAVMKIRGSKGVEISKYYGNYRMKSNDILAFSRYNEEHSIMVECKVKEVKENVCFQVAVMRSVNSKRLIRVVNFCIEIGSRDVLEPGMVILSSAVRCINEHKSDNGYMIEIAKKIINSGVSFCDNNIMDDINIMSDINSINNNILNRGSNIIYNNITSSTNNMNTSNTVSLPLLFLSAMKSVALRQSSYTPSDYKTYYSYLITNHNYALTKLLLKTKLYNIKQYILKEELKETRLTENELEIDGIYLLDTGVNIYIFIGLECEKEISDNIFDPELESGRVIVDSTVCHPMLLNFIDELKLNRMVMPNVILVRDDASQNVFRDVFMSYLVEDKNCGLMGLNEFTGLLAKKG